MLRLSVIGILFALQFSISSQARTEDFGLFEAELLSLCHGQNGDLKVCRQEARIAGEHLKLTGTPRQCRGLRTVGGTAFHHCLLQFAGTPRQCRALRDADAGPSYYFCLRRHVSNKRFSGFSLERYHHRDRLTFGATSPR